ncbi:sensor histidine kinase [Sphaerisporangium flaviroseum]|uniref:Sensor histidine kinase n=1 Tax=Sphaerisporangium flaviroseum TaxID=509199 RepID=A0ABP7HWH7_9ACTN
MLEESARRPGRRAARAGSIIWPLVLAGPLWAFVINDPGPAKVAWSLVALSAFVTCWIRLMWQALGVHGMTPVPWALVGLCASALALFPVLGYLWAYYFFLFVVSALATLPRIRDFTVGVSLTVLVEPVAFWTEDVPLRDFWWVPVATLVQAALVHAFRTMGRMLHELNLARAETARLAVDNERLRFARDLHDTLGHTLTSIVIRSQLAARLARSDADQAAQEMADVERVARQALDDVRDTVTGYRAVSLPGELDNARSTLALAGIDLDVSSTATPVPVAVQSLLAWAVREGTTNVLRHSRAARCSIRLWADPVEAGVEICDDGRLANGHRPGYGLTGLTERVTAAGGTLDAGPLAGGGYRMCARVPVEAT